MKLFFKLFSTINLIFTALFCDLAASEDRKCDQTENVNFLSYNIFDLTNKDTIFLHRWANFLHIKTKQKTLINESAFFLNKCQINDDDLLELERHLRKEKYIRDAAVTYHEDNTIEVQTWDNWSLMPTVDFVRKGGQNKFAIGMQDRNLLGLGIDAEIEYFSNAQRTGYKFKTRFPLYLKNNTNASIRMPRNDHGTSEAVLMQKKFVSFNTNNAYKIGFNNFNQIDTQYKYGVESNKYIHYQYYSTANWQWLHQDSVNDNLRFGLGYTHEKLSFLALTETGLTSTLPSEILPSNRTFNYPFLSVEYLQKDYRKLTNLNVINHIEDFNSGWIATASVGSDLTQKKDSPKLVWKSHLSKGFDVFGDAIWLFEASFEGEVYDNSEHENRLLLNINTEYFHKFNDKWGVYFKKVNLLGKNQFLDSPVVLGGESGVKGYPLQYQHGDHSTHFTFETRYYPHINIYKLIELGGAAFIDTGRVFGQPELSQNPSLWMTSVGLDARFFQPTLAKLVSFTSILLNQFPLRPTSIALNSVSPSNTHFKAIFSE
jgi:hypothetical protein